MKNETSWSTLILSNVLLTLPVTFSFAVLGGLAAVELQHLLRSSIFIHGLVAPADEIRTRLMEYAVIGGFAVSQVCFALRYAQRADAPWPLIPFRPRVRLASAVLLTLAAGASLWLNMNPVTITEESATRCVVDQGWPFTCRREVSLNPKNPRFTPQELEEGHYVDCFWGSVVVNVLICADLLLILLIVIDAFLSRRERRNVAPAPPVPAVSTSSTGVLSS